jgi:hypothetical protein
VSLELRVCIEVGGTEDEDTAHGVTYIRVLSAETVMPADNVPQNIIALAEATLGRLTSENLARAEAQVRQLAEQIARDAA